MGDALMLGVLVLGWVIATRLIYTWMVRDCKEGEHPGLLMPAFLGLLWPLALGVCVVIAPFLLVGWLASLGVKR